MCTDEETKTRCLVVAMSDANFNPIRRCCNSQNPISHGAKTDPLGMKRSGGSCGNTYILLHATIRKVRAGVRHTAHESDKNVDTSNACRDYYSMNIPWCQNRPIRNEKVERELWEYLYFVARTDAQSSLRRPAQRP